MFSKVGFAMVCAAKVDCTVPQDAAKANSGRPMMYNDPIGYAEDNERKWLYKGRMYRVFVVRCLSSLFPVLVGGITARVSPSVKKGIFIS